MPQKESTLLPDFWTPCSPTSSLQKCEKLTSVVEASPSLWHFVMAALAD